ncbi:probable G-protein coupled receptor 158 [Phlebotomus argentipes]|uniref:probable G-protein coupled receptor 158 n=1 Tax=Phlebotomus argentipes TaxID=94469 RepID=UPI0028933AE7|nr:probable G-protein coupled receptor 158 [Phlebotomus argentipes]
MDKIKLFKLSRKNLPNSPVFTVGKSHRSGHRGAGKAPSKANHTSRGLKRKREHGEHHHRPSNLALEAMFYQSDSSSWDNEERFRESESSAGSAIAVNTTVATEAPTEATTKAAQRNNRLVNSSSADFRQYDEVGGEADVPGLFSPSGLYSDDEAPEEADDGQPESVLAEWGHELIEEEQMQFDETTRNNRLNLMKGRDVVTRFLQIVESQHLLGANCTAGTALNLGEGVVDRYAQDRFRIEAEVAVNRANMLTRIFKLTLPAVQESEHLLHASVLSMVEFDDDIFAAGNCFDWNQHPAKKGLFCPFAYRLPPPDQGASLAKDLAAEYHYLGNTSEWFFLARKNAEKVISRNEQYIKSYHLYSNSSDRVADEILSVKYEDGRWSKPYYDCGGGNIWMLTYTVPFFGYENGTYFFKGTSGIDIDLRRVDIDQCPQRISSSGVSLPLNIFAGTDKCKARTTECEAISGLGFRRGSYKCVCRRGFYFPDTTSSQKYFNGSTLEEEYEKLMLGESSMYRTRLAFECLPCAEGCDSCKDSSPCVAALNWPMRTSILVMACAIIGFLPPAAFFTFKYQQVKVVRAASPALLRVIALGAFFIYCTTIVLYPPPSLYTCTARVWLREIGFSLTYGALMLKTWRISVIFRVRSAKAVKITDASLLKRLGILCGAVGAFLLIRTIVAPPRVVVGRTTDDLKAYLCKTDWWDHTFTSMEVLFLAWGVRLCIMVRKAPSEFNESRFISMAIYNEFLLTCFLNVSMLFLQSPANPDLLFIIFFCHTQLTVTLLLALIFGSKVYLVFRGGGKPEDSIGLGTKPSGAKFICRSQGRTLANASTATSSTAQLALHAAHEGRLTEQEALEEIKHLCSELQRVQERAPPRGVAVATIATLLESLRCSHPPTLRPPGHAARALEAGHADKATNTLSVEESHWYHESNGGARIVLTEAEDKESLKKLRKCLEECPTLAAAPNSVRPPARPNLNGMESLSIDVESKSCDLDFAELQLECMCSSDSVADSPTLRQNPDGAPETHSEHVRDAQNCGCDAEVCCKCREGVSSSSRSTTSGKARQSTSESPSTADEKTLNEEGEEEKGIRRTKSTDSSKLILDLNDRSKFTKEVSV